MPLNIVRLIQCFQFLRLLRGIRNRINTENIIWFFSVVVLMIGIIVGINILVRQKGEGRRQELPFNATTAPDFNTTNNVTQSYRTKRSAEQTAGEDPFEQDAEPTQEEKRLAKKMEATTAAEEAKKAEESAKEANKKAMDEKRTKDEEKRKEEEEKKKKDEEKKRKKDEVADVIHSILRRCKDIGSLFGTVMPDLDNRDFQCIECVSLPVSPINRSSVYRVEPYCWRKGLVSVDEFSKIWSTYYDYQITYSEWEWDGQFTMWSIP